MRNAKWTTIAGIWSPGWSDEKVEEGERKGEMVIWTIIIEAKKKAEYLFYPGTCMGLVKLPNKIPGQLRIDDFTLIFFVSLWSRFCFFSIQNRQIARQYRLFFIFSSSGGFYVHPELARALILRDSAAFDDLRKFSPRFHVCFYYCWLTHISPIRRPAVRRDV